MDPSHGREIHYHLARALMRLNTIAGFLSVFEPTVDWDEHPHDPYGRPLRPSISKQLHTLSPIPLLRPLLLSHLMAGYPLTWSWIRNLIYALFPYVVNLVPLRTDHHPASHPAAVEYTSSTRARPPISGPSVHTMAVTSPHTIDPIARDSLSKDARPKKKQRAMNTATSSTTTKTPCQRGDSLPASHPWHSSRRFQLRRLWWSNISWTSCIQSSTGFTTAREPKCAGEWYITTSNCRCCSDPSNRQVKHSSTTSHSGNHCPVGPSFPSL